MSDEKTLSEALRIQAGGAGTPKLTLDDVQGRARRIRRTRAAVATTGAAALVAAAVIPVALLVGSDRASDTIPPVDTPTVSDTANPLATSHPPGWVVGGEVRSGDGTAFTPALEGGIFSLLRLGADRWLLGAYPDESAFQVSLVDATGSVLATYDAADAGLVGDGRGTAAVWVAADGRSRLLLAGEDEPVVLPSRVPSGSRLLKVLPGCTADSCTTIVEARGVAPEEETSFLRMEQDGTVARYEVPGLVSLTDISPDGTLASGYTSIDERAFEFCSAVVEIATGEQLWETCDASSFRFSPDGTKVLAVDAYLSGIGHAFAEVRSARDGEVLQHYQGATVLDERWESDDSYLVSIQTNAGENVLLRVELGQEEPEVLDRDGGSVGDPSGIRLGG